MGVTAIVADGFLCVPRQVECVITVSTCAKVQILAEGVQLVTGRVAIIADEAPPLFCRYAPCSPCPWSVLKKRPRLCVDTRTSHEGAAVFVKPLVTHI